MCCRPTSVMEAGKEEQRSVARFLTAEGVGGREIRRRMSVVYGEHSMSRSRVLAWHKRFREGRVSLQDDARPGQAHRVITPDVIAALDGHILANRRINVEEISLLMAISHGSIHAIVTKHLLYRKICAQWVPHQLTEEQKTQRMAASLGHLQRYHEEEEQTAEPAVETREFSLTEEIQNRTHKFRKVMMTFFFDSKGPLLVEFLEHGTTVSAQRYEDTLQKLRRAIKSKCPGMLSNGIIIPHDNARPHTANSVRNTLQRFGWEVLQHPPYSPDLSPCDFHFFGDLKGDIRGHRFASDEDVCGWVKLWFRRQPTSFSMDGLDRLIFQ
ncbi:hypothetical protein B7P43_G08284 [Cryptotermes secundus]|uniref:Mos1 transposase HTH domain-containing protein n=1 Tax=Cryptotermes secundus TaxID=105785 RepID=A0A2J7RH99_9NEOP|nr:hypothetical protein B7P43_G08284 [Cryptotermes secundus]